jgi:hypothetical protein
MIPFFVRMWKTFWMDEAAAARIFRGFLLWAGGMAVNVLAFPWTVVQAWTWQEWSYRVAAAGALGFAGIVSAGQKNPTADQIRTVASEPIGSPPPPGMK